MEWEKLKVDSFYSQTLEYWYDEWNSISEQVKNGMIGINIMNARIVLSDIINEYELNKFESDNNRKVYIKLIDTLISKNYISTFREELNILKDKLEKKEKQMVYVIAKELSKIISNQSFAYVLFDELFPILENKLFEKKDRVKIKEITKEIIVDLVTSGMDIEDVKKLVSDSFKSYFLVEEEIFITYKGVPEELKTKEEQREYIDGLSILNRLDFFKQKLISSENEYVFIYPIWGLTTIPQASSNNRIFDCQLYRPNIEKMLDESLHFDEQFKLNSQSNTSEVEYDYQSECNAMVSVRSTSLNSAKNLAENKLFSLINLLNLYHANQYREIFWDGQYVGEKVGATGSYHGFIGSSDDKNRRRNISKRNPLFLTNKKYQDVEKVSRIIKELETRELLYEAETILSVINIMSQAIWQNDENKLLSYWIAIESLANISKKEEESKFHFVKETISNIYFLWERFDPVHKLFRLTGVYSGISYKEDNTVNIPHEFLQNVGVYKSYSEDSEVHLKMFFERMEELKSYTTKESFLDEIDDTITFYQDNKVALHQLNKKRNAVRLTVDYIYKCRNQIVHNGYVDKNLVPYLINFSEAYATSLFDRILYVYSEGQYNLQNHFIKEGYEAILLDKKLSSRNHYTLDLEESI